MPEITMPRLSDTMEEGVVVAWLKQVGDKVTRGDVLAEIETDKALMELEAYDDGVLEQILAEPGTRVSIGNPIALIGDGTGSVAKSVPPVSAPPVPTESATDGAAAATTAEVVRTQETSATAVQGGRPKSSPLARKIARELGVDLAAVTGTGPAGRITRQDVESAAQRVAESVGTEATAVAATGAASESAPVQGIPAGYDDFEEVPLTTVQQVSAKRLTESMQQAPHIYLTSAIDVTDLLAFRADINETLRIAGAGKVSVNDLIVKAVAATLRADSSVNVSYAGDKLLRHNGVHIGVAVAIPAGLVVPVIRDADRKSVSEIAAESRDKAERARARKLRADEMSGGTFTISNLGMFGIEQFTAVINPPQAAILAVGAAADEVQLIDGQVVGRKILRVTLSADHRAVDGATAATFLQQLKGVLEHPLRIVT
ncbi:dihydrolipoamide acetyltransferase family protein [Nocardia sp. NBC_01009]|uniref:dihydrolipoamide acetyltransferase family protein n=1 Tax=Nocardia sp. NBC_01009 TaxID=2975996 RepID=UPI003869942F|nr:2-oxo acid dehydrogenase subunit E2 [Nocardia sp. NBC_01009]